MDLALLATKVQIPPRPRLLVQRKRLIDSLERGVPHHKLTLISAPAGYGKTTLLTDWAHHTDMRVGWISLGDEGNDVERCLRYLVAAWEGLDPDIRTTPLGLLLEPMSPDIDRVLRAFVNLACEQEIQTAFVLDDIHLIDEHSVLDALAFLIDNLPSHMHFILAGRGEPALPLSRYRARREVLELRSADLEFLDQEFREFFRSAKTIDVTDEELTSLQSQLEGWIAGLQLVSLAAGGNRRIADSASASGRQRFIADYLRDEVLAGLDEDVRFWLVQTSILDRLSSPLCDAVTGREDGQAVLELLERRCLFISPLDERREWFRIHPLLAEYLRDELQKTRPAEVHVLHRRAAKWYLNHDLPEPAFSHAVLADDVETGTQVCDSYVISKLESGEIRIVQRWVESTPAEWFVANPSLSLYRGAYMAFLGDIGACVRMLDEAEDRLSRDERQDKPHQLAKLAVARCAMACFQNDVPEAEHYAQQALQGLGPEDVTLLSNIHHALADTYRRNFRWSEAREHYQHITTLTHDPSWKVRSAHVFGAMADLELMQGRLQAASELWAKARAAVEQPQIRGLLPVPIIGWVYIRTAELLYEWNQLSEVRNLLEQGLERAELGGDVRAMVAGYLVGGRLRLTQGQVDQASEYLEKARPLVEQTSLTEWAGRFERLQLELWLAEDRIRAAVEWSDRVQCDDVPPDHLQSDVRQLAVARVLLFKGDPNSRQKALTRLDGLIATASAANRKGVEIEGLALRALAYSAEGDAVAAMTSLEHSLRLAEPEGYVRLFVDLGLPMGRLLQEARSRQVAPEYVDRLLAAFETDLQPQSQVYRSLPEPLSAREREILDLVAAGLTNREIAETLFISAETVKKHISNIYDKLQVGHRTEAVARAKELQLLRP